MGRLPLVLRRLTGRRADTRRPDREQVRSWRGQSASLRAAGLGARHLVPRPTMTDWMMARAVSLRGF